jgi:hypothetical protein
MSSRNRKRRKIARAIKRSLKEAELIHQGKKKAVTMDEFLKTF